jgi:hypothetical protein
MQILKTNNYQATDNPIISNQHTTNQEQATDRPPTKDKQSTTKKKELATNGNQQETNN